MVDAYLLTLGSLVLLGGSLGDRLGRRRVFAIGVGGFGVASALCALAPSIGVLIGLRALQGVFAALLVPSSLAIITETYSGTARGAAIGAWTAWTSAAIAFGPPLGGVLVDLISWRAVFAMNVPLVVATLWLIAGSVPGFPPGGGRLDLVGGALCALGLSGPVLALIEQPARGWGDPLVIGAFAAGVALMAAFVGHERRTAEPMLPLELFKVREFAVANAATVAIYAGLGALTFLVALYLQQVAGYGATAAGLSLMPVTVMLVAFSRRFGALAARIGPRLVMGLGPLLAASGALLFLRLGRHVSYAADLLPAATLFGLGMSATVAPLTATVLGATDRGRAGVASGVNNALARVASLLAIALVGVVVSLRFTGVLDARVAAAGLPAAQRALVAGVRARPLTRAAGASGPLAEAATAASISAFRYGVGAAALLIACGGVIALGGLSGGLRSEPPAGGALALRSDPADVQA